MDALYREAILDHYKHPRRKGHLEHPDIHYHDHNPFCGDELTISQATASMLMEEIVGKSLDELKMLDKEYILELLGIEIGPVRLKCALLSLKVLKAGAYGLEEWPE